MRSCYNYYTIFSDNSDNILKLVFLWFYCFSFLNYFIDFYGVGKYQLILRVRVFSLISWSRFLADIIDS